VCPYLHSFGHAAQTLQHPPPSRSTRRGLSGIECRPVQRSPSGCAWVQGATGGVYGHRSAPPGQSRHHRKNKKRPTSPSQIKTHLIVQVSKNSEKNKKTPYGAIECVILAKERWN
jgi:hypothetical protein